MTLAAEYDIVIPAAPAWAMLAAFAVVLVAAIAVVVVRRLTRRK